MDVKNVRFITYDLTQYLRVEDVAELLLEFGSTEETDVRTRIEALASSLLSRRPKTKTT